jgi:phosphoglycerate dehydrogenase-like enzyme
MTQAPTNILRKRIGLACRHEIRRNYVDDADLARLGSVADVRFEDFSVEPAWIDPVQRDSDEEARLARFASDLDVLIVSHGAPYVSSDVLAAAPRLSLIGELEGDRFGYRIDLAAAEQRGVLVVDTSHASSLPTAEWALALALIGRRNAGALFRTMIAHEPSLPHAQRSGLGYAGAELQGKSIGMIGFGHIGRHLAALLRPFGVQIAVFDPFAPRDLADACGVDFGPLEAILDRDVVFVLVPHTPATDQMLGAEELVRLQSGSVLVNVSRGRVIDSDALIRRLEQRDMIACLDVFDPEPVPPGSRILDLPNVFLTPHIAGYTQESRRRFFAFMVDECLRHFARLEPHSRLTAANVRLGPR